MSFLFGNFGYTSCDGPSLGCYIKNQSAFYLHEGFTLSDLKDALAKAKKEGQDTVYAKNPRKGYGSTGLSTWYVEALILQLEKEGKA